MRSNTRLSAALAALAIAAAIAAPPASARPIGAPAVAVTCDPSAVPPPPSSIAASAAKEYAILRACGAERRDLRAAPVRQDLRSTDVRDAASPQAPAVVDSPPSELTGFDWTSAAIGAAGGTGLMVVALALAVGGRRALPRRPGHGRHTLMPRR